MFDLQVFMSLLLRVGFRGSTYDFSIFHWELTLRKHILLDLHFSVG